MSTSSRLWTSTIATTSKVSDSELDYSRLFLTHLGEERLHLLAELSGVVAKNIRIVSFAFNPAPSFKDILGLCTFYDVGNF